MHTPRLGDMFNYICMMLGFCDSSIYLWIKLRGTIMCTSKFEGYKKQCGPLQLLELSFTSMGLVVGACT